MSGDDLKLLLDYIIKIREYYNDNVNKYEDLIVKYTNILDENQQLKKQKDDVVEYIKTTTYSDIIGLEKHNITEFWFIKDLLRMLGDSDV